MRKNNSACTDHLNLESALSGSNGKGRVCGKHEISDTIWGLPSTLPSTLNFMFVSD